MFGELEASTQLSGALSWSSTEHLAARDPEDVFATARCFPATRYFERVSEYPNNTTTTTIPKSLRELIE